MKNKYMIIMDLDDTLLCYNKTITRLTYDYLNNLHNKGHVLAIATGRIFSSCYEVVKDLSFIDYIITDSGSVIYNKNSNKFIKKDFFSKSDIKFLLKLSSLSNINYIDFSDLNFYYKYSKYMQKNYDLSISINNKKNIINKDDIIHSSIWLNDNLSIELISNYINNCNNHLYAFIMCDSSNLERKWIEVVKKNVSKFNAIKFISNIEKIDIKNTISFGDSYNDLEMILKCGVGVSMENAIDELKKKAKYVTKSCNDNGIVYFLERYINDN